MHKIYKNRILSYIADLLIISIVIWLIGILFRSNDINNIYQNINNTNEEFINKQINFQSYINNYGNLNYELDKLLFIHNIINLILMLIYFSVLPFFNKGKTIGLQLFNLKIERKDYQKITILNLIIRSLVVNGTLYFFISLILVNILKGSNYFIVLSIFGLIQIILVLINIFMVKYNYEQTGLHDILSKTQIVRTKM